MTAPRIVVRGATLAISRRTTCRKAFLAPWHELVEACWLYALADAQRKHRVAIHHAVRVINHHHLTVTLREENLGAFLRDFHKDVSRSIATLLARERYDTLPQIFDAREPHVMRLLDARAQARHLLYEHLNPVAAGLVDRPCRMPGRVLQFGHWKSGRLKVKRPPIYFSKSRPEELWLEITPPPLLYEAFDGDLNTLIHHMERLSEDGCRALRSARAWPVLGSQRLRRMHPWQEPITFAEPAGQPIPTFRIGTPGREGHKLRTSAAQETRCFRRRYREARRQYLGGDHEVAFPHGTYGARLLYGAIVAEPEPEAYVCRPGPLLEDVRQGIEAPSFNLTRTEARSRSRQRLVEELRGSATDEAAARLELERLDFSRTDLPGGASTSSEGFGDARPEPLELHHLGEPLPHGDRLPRRLIIRRDRRRGRPPGRRSGDPPA